MASTFWTSLQVRNFKAIRDSGVVKLTPLTAFIGNNGVGKSSLVDALLFMHETALNGVDTAMRHPRAKGFDNLYHAGEKFKGGALYPEREDPPISVRLARRSVSLHLRAAPFRGSHDRVKTYWAMEDRRPVESVEEALTADGRGSEKIADSFQFLDLAAQRMGQPCPRKVSSGPARLNPDGSNIAEYLLELQAEDRSAFDGIVDALRYVLPYARDLTPRLASELERAAYLSLKERNFDLNGWLLSTGTLRVLALLAVLRHPRPAPLIVIEELENGLDPRTIHLIVEEIRTAVQSGRSQVIITTHSPYLLDLLSLEQIVMVERNAEGEPVFFRPGSDASMREWSDKFAPGRLYTMDIFRRQP